jgi:hypothetical protein
MKLSFSTAFGDAVTTWRRDSAVLLPLAGLTMFLPQYAVLLLVPPLASALPDLTATTKDGQPDPAAVQAAADAVSAWLSQYGGWYVLAPLFGLFGALAVMTLYLAPGRPTLGAALGRAAVLFLRYLLASILIGFAALSILLPGAMAHLLLAVLMPPAFYVLGRTMLAGPAIVADAPLGAINAIQRSWALTRGHGWMLGATYAAPLFAAQLVGGALLSLAGVGGGNPVIAAIVDGLAAVVLAAAALTLTLVEVSLYRRLANRGT